MEAARSTWQPVSFGIWLAEGLQVTGYLVQLGSQAEGGELETIGETPQSFPARHPPSPRMPLDPQYLVLMI